MDTRQAYNSWASQYDTNENKTRDLEAKALREILAGISFEHCLEIGCGTGKNTEWLCRQAKQLTAVDLSEEMLAKAREKITAATVQFQQADITQNWSFGKGTYDLVTFSLVLEHIRELDPVLRETAASLKSGGLVYVGELHPFKQYSGSKARFDTDSGVHVVQCFDHHVSDFTGAAQKNGLSIAGINEYFDNDERTGLPRILALLFKKDDG